MIDLTRLQAFLHAAENLNFSEAARHLHLAQPTISHHIKTLETELGVELFIRSGPNLRLTEEGRLLLPWARRLVRQAIQMRQMMDSLQQEIAGHLRIACSTTTGKYILPQFAARFHARHPYVRVSVLNCLPDQVVSCLVEEAANLGVVSYEACEGELECQEFFLDPIVLIAPVGHRWSARQCIEPAELLEAPFIVRESTAGTRRVMLAQLGKHGISLDDMNVILEVGNAEAIVKTVETGHGVSFVSRLAAGWALRQGAVVEVPVAGIDLRRKLFMIRQNIVKPSRAADVFWSFIHDPANMDLLRLAEGVTVPMR